MKSVKLYILCIKQEQLLKKYIIICNTVNSIELENRMDTVFIDSGNSKTHNPQRLSLNLLDKISLKRKDEYVVFSNLSIYYTWKNVEKSKNYKFKISAPAWNEEFELPDGSYSIPDICIIKIMRRLLIILQ